MGNYDLFTDMYNILRGGGLMHTAVATFVWKQSVISYSKIALKVYGHIEE